MSFIKIIPPKRATGSLKEAYQYLGHVSGFMKIPNIIKVFSLCPETMKRIIRVFELGMWMSDQPRANLELTAAAVSHLNNCHY
jgi:hypothetical protein